MLSIGNGILNEVSFDERNIINSDNVEDLIKSVFENLNMHYNYENIILCPTNKSCDIINEKVLEMFDGNIKENLSFDEISCENSQVYPTEYINSLNFPNFPPHNLKLKKFCPLILLRNLFPKIGLCNGTRLKLLSFENKILNVEIMSGIRKGTKIKIPRISLQLSETEFPFILKRRQFPVKLCFAMTINKSQGQTLNKIGIDLRLPVFSHGQLYVALSRIKSLSKLKVLLGENKKYTKNIVFKEVFQD